MASSDGSLDIAARQSMPSRRSTSASAPRRWSRRSCRRSPIPLVHDGTLVAVLVALRDDARGLFRGPRATARTAGAEAGGLDRVRRRSTGHHDRRFSPGRREAEGGLRALHRQTCRRVAAARGGGLGSRLKTALRSRLPAVLPSPSRGSASKLASYWSRCSQSQSGRSPRESASPSSTACAAPRSSASSPPTCAASTRRSAPTWIRALMWTWMPDRRVAGGRRLARSPASSSRSSRRSSGSASPSRWIARRPGQGVAFYRGGWRSCWPSASCTRSCSGGETSWCSYALCGFFLLFFRHSSQRSILVWAHALYWFMVVLFAGFYIATLFGTAPIEPPNRTCRRSSISTPAARAPDLRRTAPRTGCRSTRSSSS